MSSTTRLLVLGVVRGFQPVHGYEVRRELVLWHAHEWASVKPGSIYNALKSLTRDGFLEVVGTDQVGSRPERTTYRLTAAGDEKFRAMLRDQWWRVRPVVDPLMAAVTFIGFVSRHEAITALEHRVSQVQGVVRHLEFASNSVDGRDSPYHVREMHRLFAARTMAEIEWAKAFIARLKNGEYITADDPPWQPGAEADKSHPPANGTKHGKSRRPPEKRRNGKPPSAPAAASPSRRSARTNTRSGANGEPAQRKQRRSKARPPARSRRVEHD